MILEFCTKRRAAERGVRSLRFTGRARDVPVTQSSGPPLTQSGHLVFPLKSGRCGAPRTSTRVIARDCFIRWSHGLPRDLAIPAFFGEAFTAGDHVARSVAFFLAACRHSGV